MLEVHIYLTTLVKDIVFKLKDKLFTNTSSTEPHSSVLPRVPFVLHLNSIKEKRNLLLKSSTNSREQEVFRNNIDSLMLSGLVIKF